MKRRTRLGEHSVRVVGLYVHPDGAEPSIVDFDAFATLNEARGYALAVVAAAQTDLELRPFKEIRIVHRTRGVLAAFQTLEGPIAADLPPYRRPGGH